MASRRTSQTLILIGPLVCWFCIGNPPAARAQGPYAPRNLEPMADLQGIHLEEIADYDWTLWRRQNYLSMGTGSKANRRHWDLWAHGTYDLATTYATGGHQAYSGDTWGVAGGVDRAVGPLLLGTSVAYFNRISDFDAPDARLNTDFLNVGVYGSWDPRPLGVDAAVTYTHTWDKARRWIDGVSPSTLTDGETNADYLSSYLFARYDLPVAVFTITPTVGFRYARGERSGWAESGGGVYDLLVEGSSRESLVSDLGVVLVSEILPVWQLQLYAFWEHELGDDQGSATARYRGPGAVFEVDGMEFGRDAGRFGAILSREVTRKFTFYAAYDGLFRDRYDNHQVNIGGVISF